MGDDIQSSTALQRERERKGEGNGYYNQANTINTPSNIAPVLLSPLLKPSAAAAVGCGADMSAVPDPEPDCFAPGPEVCVALEPPDVGELSKLCFWPRVGRADVGTTSHAPFVKAGQAIDV